MSTDTDWGSRGALHLQVTVRSGKKIEITAEELQEGETVDVFLVLPNRAVGSAGSIIDYLDSLPPGPRSFATWEEVEQSFQNERDSWDH